MGKTEWRTQGCQSGLRQAMLASVYKRRGSATGSPKQEAALLCRTARVPRRLGAPLFRAMIFFSMSERKSGGKHMHTHTKKKKERVFSLSDLTTRRPARVNKIKEGF